MNDCIDVKKEKKEKKWKSWVITRCLTYSPIYLTVVYIDELQNRIGFDQSGKISLPLQEHPRQRNPLAGVLKRFGLTPRGEMENIDYEVNNSGRETRLPCKRETKIRQMLHRSHIEFGYGWIIDCRAIERLTRDWFLYSFHASSLFLRGNGILNELNNTSYWNFESCGNSVI